MDQGHESKPVGLGSRVVGHRAEGEAVDQHEAVIGQARQCLGGLA